MPGASRAIGNRQRKFLLTFLSLSWSVSMCGTHQTRPCAHADNFRVLDGTVRNGFQIQRKGDNPAACVTLQSPPPRPLLPCTPVFTQLVGDQQPPLLYSSISS
ncbi:unnamed protein product, partial [Ectocarpus sp. 4 AP-2014]